MSASEFRACSTPDDRLAPGRLSAWALKHEPRAWQLAALETWKQEMRGVISVVTGGGKTVFAQLCILDFRKRFPEGTTLILVPTLALLDQWVVDLQEESGVSPEEIGILSGQERITDEKPIVVAVLNSARTFTESFTKNKDVFLIVDECHRVGSPENAKALTGQFRATLGLSATPEREYDRGFDALVKPRLGTIIFEYSYVDAATDGVITKLELVNVEVSFLPDEKAEYQRFSRLIARALRSRDRDQRSDERLKRLLQRRAAVSASATMRIPVATRLVEMHPGERTIVFHERVAAADKILDLLRARGHRATVYHAKVHPTLRRDNLRLFRRGMFDVLVCCRALDEGMNVPEASVAIIASSTASQRQRIQRLGRILRKSRGKDVAIVYTIFATDEERKRLIAEADKMREISGVIWQKGRVRSDASA